MKTNQFYCVSCKKKVTCNAADTCVVKTKNGRSALKSKCRCGCKLYKFISDASAPRMRSKRGKCKSKSRRKSPKKSKRKSVKKSKRRSRSRS